MTPRRAPDNPILTPAMVSPSRPGFEVVGVFNPAVIRHGDDVVLLLRVAEAPAKQSESEVAAPVFNARSGRLEIKRWVAGTPGVDVSDPRVIVFEGRSWLTSISHLRVARSCDGIRFDVEPTPAMSAGTTLESFGIEDARITSVDGTFWINYTAVSPLGIATALASTKDFRTFTRHGIIFPPNNRDVTIFPEKIGGRYVALHRPMPERIGEPAIWVASSSDMLGWGDHRFVARGRPGAWDGAKIGGGAVPFRVPGGWLAVYHGVSESPTEYALGALLLDANDPSIVIARSREPILKPEMPYERQGFFGGVVFTCGLLSDSDRIRVYYGAADGVTAVAGSLARRDTRRPDVIAMDDNPPFELGINYWPQRQAMYMWRDLDLGEVRDGLEHIADMGFDTVRLFPLAQDFLPERERIDGRMISRLVDVARVAKNAGLSIVPTVIVINMSGTIWWPDWMLSPTGAPVNIYSDPSVVRSLTLLAGACASALAGDASVRAIDIANEIDGAQRPPSREAARAWTSAMAGAIRKAAPGVPVRIGAHLPSLTTENQMRIDDLGSILDEDVIHAYPLYSEHARSVLDPELVPFSCALTAGLSGKNRLTLMQEFGLCTAPRGSDGVSIVDDFLGRPRTQYLASEEEGAAYYESVIDRLMQTGAAGAYAWCYGDYAAQLFARPPLDKAVRERTFGLVRADGSEKPAAQTFRILRKRRDAGDLARGKVRRVLDVSAADYYRSPGAHFKRLYGEWLAGHA